MSTSLADDWPQWRGPTRDGVWSEKGIVDRLPAGPLQPVWRQPIGAGYSGPTVAGGRVYVMDRMTEPKQIERILCFDAASGKPEWHVDYDCEYTISYTAGPRASVTIDGGVAYAIGAMGHFHAIDAATGEILWRRDLNAEYKIRMPIWGIAGSPLVLGNSLILHIGGSDGACVVALDRKTGKEQWRSLDDRAQYAAPMVVRQGGRPIVVCWTGDSVAGIDPEDGKAHWQVPMKPRNMPIGIATPIVQGDMLFVTSFYDGSLMLRLDADEPKVETVWRRIGLSEKDTDALHSIISTPLFLGDHLYGVDSYGELRCLRADNGDRVWEDLSATPKARWSNIHFVVNGDRVWMFNERGELIISTLSPDGFNELSRALLIEPTREQLPQRGGVCWAHPAFANRHVFARNDNELVCVSLAAE